MNQFLLMKKNFIVKRRSITKFYDVLKKHTTVALFTDFLESFFGLSFL